MRAAVVGGGLAGLAAALELVDAGHEVTLLEARPTLGGAVQTLPEREGDPRRRRTTASTSRSAASPSTCASSTASARAARCRRDAARAAGDRRATGGSRRSVARPRSSSSRYRHLPLARPAASSRNAAARLRRHGARRRDVRRAAPPARLLATRRSSASGTSSSARRSTCRSDEASADAGHLHRADRAARRRARRATCCCPTQPLGAMHGERPAARSRRPGATVETDARVDVARRRSTPTRSSSPSPPRRVRAPARRARPGARGLADRERPPALRPAAARARRSPRCSAADAHWVFDRGALTGHAAGARAST